LIQLAEMAWQQQSGPTILRGITNSALQLALAYFRLISRLIFMLPQGLDPAC
jgi:hypothetical protein